MSVERLTFPLQDVLTKSDTNRAGLLPSMYGQEAQAEGQTGVVASMSLERTGFANLDAVPWGM
jgi:hypothetical protein